MIKVKQAIVVEGRYDKNTLKQLIDAPIFTVDGFGVMHNRSLLNLLRQVAEKRGLIILTDSDGAGFVIRNYLKGALPRQGVLHAYIPDVYGKEKRKKKPGKEGKLGVEGHEPGVCWRPCAGRGRLLRGRCQLRGQGLSPRRIWRTWAFPEAPGHRKDEKRLRTGCSFRNT